MTGLISACLLAEPQIVRLTRDLVAEESPSTDRTALERCAGVLASRLADAGASVERVDAGASAAHILADWAGGGPPVLLVGHFDTVWPVGQLARMPLEEKDGKLFGPGVLDMKAGLAIGITAARLLVSEVPAASRPRVRLLATTDEEIGSATSRAAIETLARESAAVLVLEPALPGGAVKTARKGVGEFELVVDGISSHAGADPGAGASAVHELARQITAIAGLSDPGRGLTVNVGVVEGGTRSNVVAERARAWIDVRIARIEDAAHIEHALAALRPADARVKLTVTGRINRPPMERTAGVARLYDMAKDVARGMGRALAEGATGGASDGNFTAALGIPTLDGLGAVGDGPHALHEHVVIKELAPRTALVAGLLARLGDN
ncbi:MAG TPA: M20 family metallopeptidase [Vicinamibacterales bacterium]|nr:M20 family metallopeptidase [Vicinamibacterales bacterium]